jgi:hypothetical protein
MYLYRYILILYFLLIAKNVIGQTIFSNNGKYGILDNESKKVSIPTEYDTIIARSKYEFFGEDYSHSFILKKRNKYYFALKKHWFTSIRKESKDGWRTYPYLESGDSTKWELFNQEFDTLYRLEELISVVSRKDATIQDFETHLGDTCLQIYKSIHIVIYRKEGKYGLLTFDRTSRTFGSYVVGQLRYTQQFFSLDDIKIHPAKYDRIIPLPIGNDVDDKLLVTLSKKKYGIINLGENIEIEPQFDAVPIKLFLNSNFNSSDYEHSYYCVKKNGLWGIIYLSTKNNNFIVCVPFLYQSLADIRSVDFYERHFFDEEKAKRVQYKNKYISCVYYSKPDTVPMQLEFIILEGETNLPTKWNNTNNKKELNKNYIPQTERHITFSPTMNGKPVVQQREYEYLCTSNIHNITSSYSGNSEKWTTPLFFVLKMDRSEDVVNNDFNLYRRGETKKDVSHSARIIYPMFPTFDYINRKPKAIAIYRFIDDNFIPLFEFLDEDSTVYEVVTEYKSEVESYSPVKKSITYTSDFILKSTKLENEKYKHTFFTFEGKKMYEVTSKYPIDYWEFFVSNPYYTYSSIPIEDFTLEFYAITQGKRKEKKNVVCRYNVKTKQFLNDAY